MNHVKTLSNTFESSYRASLLRSGAFERPNEEGVWLQRLNGQLIVYRDLKMTNIYSNSSAVVSSNAVK